MFKLTVTVLGQTSGPGKDSFATREEAEAAKEDLVRRVGTMVGAAAVESVDVVEVPDA